MSCTLHNSQCSSSGGAVAPLFCEPPAKRRRVAKEDRGIEKCYRRRAGIVRKITLNYERRVRRRAQLSQLRRLKIRHVGMNRRSRFWIDPGRVPRRGITLPAFAAPRFFIIKSEFFAFHGAWYVNWLWWFAHIVAPACTACPVPFGSGHSVNLGIGTTPFAAGFGFSSARPSTSSPAKSGAAA